MEPKFLQIKNIDGPNESGLNEMSAQKGYYKINQWKQYLTTVAI